MEITWKDCEPTMENFMTNVTRLDPLYNLGLMSCVFSGYYAMNKGKSPKDLETFLRTNADISVGLIASDWRKDKHYSNLVNSGLGAIIKRKHFDKIAGKKYTKIQEIPKEYLADYVTLISCRPREYVVKETLTHSSTMEENFEKLEEAGDYVHFDSKNVDAALTDGDIKIDESEMELSKKIGMCEKLVTVKKLDLQKTFQEDMANNGGAHIKIFARMTDGSSIMGMFKNGKMVSDIGFSIFVDENNQQKTKYIHIPSLRLR